MEEYVEHRVKTKVEQFVRSVVKIVFIMVLIAVFILLFGYAFMWLWNWLMPEIFGLTTIDYWQAVGILVLAKLVFGGFEGHGPKKNGKKSKDRCRPRNRWSTKNDFSKWKHYDQFWAEEGEDAYKDYVARNQSENTNEPDNDDPLQQ